MKTLYLDIFSGIAGDMFIGALIDLGVDTDKLERELEKLKLEGFHLHIARRQKSGIEGVKFDVHLADDSMTHHHEHDHAHHHEHHHHHDDSRNFSEIKKLISRSKLSAWVKQKSIAVFQRIAEAEGKIHGLPPEEVHFHEVGAVDSIVDIVGACIALEMLGKPRVLAAPVVEGTGWIDCAHGRFPVPAPATLAILGARGIGVTQCDEPHELVTPTGAALLAEFVESFGPMENLAAEKIGFGLGTRENKTRPNVLRAVLGAAVQSPKSKVRRLRSNWIGKRIESRCWKRIWTTSTRKFSAHFVETALGCRRAGRFSHADPDEEKPARRFAHGFVRGNGRGQIFRNDFARNHGVWRAPNHCRAAEIAPGICRGQNAVRKSHRENRAAWW